MLRFLFYVAIATAIIVGLAYGYGASLPREHTATSRVVVAQPIDAVWAVVRNPAALLATWGDLTRAERVSDPSGRETWSQTVDGFEMRIQITEASPPTRMVTTVMAAADAPFGGTWTYQLAPAPGGGTAVTITEAGWIGNPLYRVMGRVFGLHGSIEGYLEAMGQHFNEVVRPERVGR